VAQLGVRDQQGSRAASHGRRSNMAEPRSKEEGGSRSVGGEVYY
jgi:hypothetical protein